jgi:hypothetical protein
VNVTPTKLATPNYINHVAIVIDTSLSTTPIAPKILEVTEAQIRSLAEQSRLLDQETRVSVYVFSDDVRCLIFDKDVLRLPSLAGLYEVGGNTALVAAVKKSQDDLAQTAQLYGDHAFLTYVITDGEENVSPWSTVFGGNGRYRRSLSESARYTAGQVVEQLRRQLTSQPDNWTVACLVPDMRGVHAAKSFGFPAANVAVWDATSEVGVEAAFDTITRSTKTFMTNRALGVRGSKTIFAGGADQVNRTVVRAEHGFKQLPTGSFLLCDVREGDPEEIRPFVEHYVDEPYRPGSAFYELVKPEKIQPQKKILVRNRKSGRVYEGDAARQLLNLPNHEVRVKPTDNTEYQIFVQSTSVNRKLPRKTKLIVLRAV